MLEAYDNLWDIAKGGCDAVVITTNGFVRKDGQAVMGRGIAKEAADRYPELPALLGKSLKQNGNRCAIFSGLDEFDIVTFPVKPSRGQGGIPGWKVKAEIDLIDFSTRELVHYADRYDWLDVVMPRPGCGYGSLRWEQVKPVIEPLLDNRFTVVTWHP